MDAQIGKQATQFTGTYLLSLFYDKVLNYTYFNYHSSNGGAYWKKMSLKGECLLERGSLLEGELLNQIIMEREDITVLTV